jgi:hypothetical protein
LPTVQLYVRAESVGMPLPTVLLALLISDAR